MCGLAAYQALERRVDRAVHRRRRWASRRRAGMLTLHADCGASMRSKPVAALLVDLDIAKRHSHLHVSDEACSRSRRSRRRNIGRTSRRASSASRTYARTAKLSSLGTTPRTGTRKVAYPRRPTSTSPFSFQSNWTVALSSRVRLATSVGSSPSFCHEASQVTPLHPLESARVLRRPSPLSCRCICG
jgi:hypothetical protein